MWILNPIVDFPKAMTLDFSQDLMTHNIVHKLGKTKCKHK